MWQELATNIQQGEVKALARAISLVENAYPGYFGFLQQLPESSVRTIGITGPPGAGKSTLTDALIGALVLNGKRAGVLCVDPTSPFNRGALLGDRIRMSEWYNHANVFIRSLATRGSLGGLHPKIIEIADVMRAAPIDYLLIETVGVGQSEVEISGLADATVVVLVPEAGDDVQTMKAGVMEIADVFVVNKADRPGADQFARNLRQMLAPTQSHGQPTAIIKTNAVKKEGIDELLNAVQNHLSALHTSDKKDWLLAEKAYHLVQQHRMQHLNKGDLKNMIRQQATAGDFNLYNFVEQIIRRERC